MRLGQHAIGRLVADICSRCIADLSHLGVVLTNKSVKYILAGRTYFVQLIRRLRRLAPHPSLLSLHSTLRLVSASLKNGLQFRNFSRPPPTMHVASFPPLNLRMLFGFLWAT
jgi:hypothetical protein